MGLESSLDTLEATVDTLDSNIVDLEGAMHGNTSAVVALTAKIEKLLEASPACVTNVFNSEGPTEETVCGFKIGDEVVYVGGPYKDGLIGRVEQHEKLPQLSSGVPVRRRDNGQLDRFPARNTILVSALRNYKPTDAKTWYHADPTGKVADWNRKVAEAATEDGLTVEFKYRKQFAHSWDPGEIKQVAVNTFRENRSNPEQSTFGGLYIDSDNYREFRLDRVEGFIKVVRGELLR